MRRPNTMTTYMDQFEAQFYWGVIIGELSLIEFAEAMETVLEGAQSITHLSIPGIRYDVSMKMKGHADLLCWIVRGNGKSGSACGRRNGTSAAEDHVLNFISGFRANGYGLLLVQTRVSYTSLSN